MCLEDACILEGAAACAATAPCAAAVGAALAGAAYYANKALHAIGDAINEVRNDGEGAVAPPLPEGNVGEDQGNTQRPGGIINSGPLAPENGGTGDAEEDFETLTGGTGKPANPEDGRPAGTLVGDNGIALRPGTETKGPRIDIPGNSETGKRPEDLHYPDP